MSEWLACGNGVVDVFAAVAAVGGFIAGYTLALTRMERKQAN